MELKHRNLSASTLLLEVRGRFDATTIEQVKATWLSDPAIRFILVEMSGTTFIDSMGLATLVSGLKTARQRGGDLVLIDPGEAVSVILQLTAMDRVIRVEPTVDEALATLPNL